jgi:hypothetical protein
MDFSNSAYSESCHDGGGGQKKRNISEMSVNKKWTICCRQQEDQEAQEGNPAPRLTRNME